MAANFNRVILAGNLTRDPELRYTGKGTACARVSLAINRKWKSETGELKEDVTFVEADAFGKTAEVLGQYCKRGNPLLIEGRLKLDQWDDKQTGQKRQRLGVIVETFQFLQSKAGGAGGESAPAAAAPVSEAEAPQQHPPDTGDDVPF